MIYVYFNGKELVGVTGELQDKIHVFYYADGIYFIKNKPKIENPKIVKGNYEEILWDGIKYNEIREFLEMEGLNDENVPNYTFPHMLKIAYQVGCVKVGVKGSKKIQEKLKNALFTLNGFFPMKPFNAPDVNFIVFSSCLIF